MRETAVGQYKVVGARAVDGVEPGGTVWLDGAVVNIPALLRAGHVEPVVAERAKPRPASRPAAAAAAAAADEPAEEG